MSDCVKAQPFPDTPGMAHQRHLQALADAQLAYLERERQIAALGRPAVRNPWPWLTGANGGQRIIPAAGPCPVDAAEEVRVPEPVLATPAAVAPASPPKSNQPHQAKGKKAAGTKRRQPPRRKTAPARAEAPAPEPQPQPQPQQVKGGQDPALPDDPGRMAPRHAEPGENCRQVPRDPTDKARQQRQWAIRLGQRLHRAIDIIRRAGQLLQRVGRGLGKSRASSRGNAVFCLPGP